MKLLQYIKGERSGREARDVELEAMCDGFVSDALDGFDAHTGDHARDIARLKKEVGGGGFAGRKVWLGIAIIAAVAVCGAVVYLLMR